MSHNKSARAKPSHRTSNGFHARKPQPAQPAQTPPPAQPETPNPEPRTARYNALKHGAYAASLDATAAQLGEDPAEVAALAAELWECYAPADAQEARVVERLAATWRRLTRLSTHAQVYLRERLAGGAAPLFALKESEAAGGEEAKLERALLRLHRHLEFLQRWRVAAAQRRVAQAHREAQTEIEAMLELNHAQSVRLVAEARERLFPQPPADGTAPASGALADLTVPEEALREPARPEAAFGPPSPASGAHGLPGNRAPLAESGVPSAA